MMSTDVDTMLSSHEMSIQSIEVTCNTTLNKPLGCNHCLCFYKKKYACMHVQLVLYRYLMALTVYMKVTAVLQIGPSVSQIYCAWDQID